MSQVNTVLGPIDPSDMGFTLGHEHITVGADGAAATNPGFQDRQAIADVATAALAEAYEGGVRTIIDVTTFDLGRDDAMMQEVSRRSGVHAIPCTGNHLAVPHVFWGAPVDRGAALFIKEIEEGIEDSGVKVGTTKVASDQGGITGNEEIVLRAAARACNATGTRISTHTWSSDRTGEEQVRILQDEGVDLKRVYIAHSNDDTNVGYLIGLLEEGAWLGRDRYTGGRTPETPRWETRTEVVEQLIDAGWAHRLMLSHDHSTPVVQPSADMRREREEFNPDGYLFITRNVLPRLIELRATDADVQAMMVDNPRRFFED